jgi:hypothetical protein
MPIYLKRAKRNPRARRNMAVRWGGATWDEWSEVPEEIQEKILAQGAASAGRSLDGIGSYQARHRPEGEKKKVRSIKSKELYFRIANSVGGMKAICPAPDYGGPKGTRHEADPSDFFPPFSGAQGKGDWHLGGTKSAAVLAKMGLSPQKALALAKEMALQEVLAHGSGTYRKSEHKQEIARRMLLAVPGFHCTTAKNNPRRRW